MCAAARGRRGGGRGRTTRISRAGRAAPMPWLPLRTAWAAAEALEPPQNGLNLRASFIFWMRFLSSSNFSRRLCSSSLFCSRIWWR